MTSLAGHPVAACAPYQGACGGDLPDLAQTVACLYCRTSVAYRRPWMPVPTARHAAGRGACQPGQAVACRAATDSEVCARPVATSVGCRHVTAASGY